MFSLNISTIIVILILIIIFYYSFQLIVSDKSLAKIPGPKPRYPLIGNLDLLIKKGVPIKQNYVIILDELAKRYEEYGIFKLYFGFKPRVYLFNHNLTKCLLSSNKYIDRAFDYQFFIKWFGSGLFLTGGIDWHNKRKMLNPAFNFKIIEDFLPIMNKQSNILIGNLRESTGTQSIDIRKPILSCTLDIICETTLGVSFESQSGKNTEFAQIISCLFETIIERIASPWIWWDFIFNKTFLGKKFKTDLKIFQSMIDKTLNEENLITTKDGDIERYFLKHNNNIIDYEESGRLLFSDLANNYAYNNLMTKDEFVNEVGSLLVAGSDTTAVTLMFAIHLLGLHPDIQLRLQKELDTTFGDQTDRDIKAADLKNLVYMECVIKETLRLYPSVPMIGRTLSEDLILNDYKITKGTDVWVLIDALHRDPNVFPDPLLYKPERFLEKTANNINAYSFIPFSAGPRNCMGQKYAMSSLKIILSKIFLNFNIVSLDQTEQIGATKELIYKPKSPIRINFVQRK